jgi:hypothetical protein
MPQRIDNMIVIPVALTLMRLIHNRPLTVIEAHRELRQAFIEEYGKGSIMDALFCGFSERDTKALLGILRAVSEAALTNDANGAIMKRGSKWLLKLHNTEHGDVDTYYEEDWLPVAERLFVGVE